MDLQDALGGSEVCSANAFWKQAPNENFVLIIKTYESP
jgi:hypothetical protein